MPEGPEFRLGIHKNFAIKLAPRKKRKITYKTVVVKKRWDSFVDLWYFLGYPFIRVTQHVVTWIYGVWIDLSWYRVECLEVGDFPRLLKCQDGFFVFVLHVIYICLLSAFEWHTLNMSNVMNSTVYLLAKLCSNCDFCGRCRDIRPGRQSLSYPEKLRWRQGWQGVLQRKDWLMV